MWIRWAVGSICAATLGVVAVAEASSGQLWGDVAAVTMILEWLLLVGAIAAIIQLPEALIYRFVGRMSAGRAVLSCLGVSLAGGAAYGLTFIDPRLTTWRHHWLTGLVVILGVELTVLGVISRDLPSRYRLLGAVAAATALLHAVAMAVVRAVG